MAKICRERLYSNQNISPPQSNQLARSLARCFAEASLSTLTTWQTRIKCVQAGKIGKPAYRIIGAGGHCNICLLLRLKQQVLSLIRYFKKSLIQTPPTPLSPAGMAEMFEGVFEARLEELED